MTDDERKLLRVHRTQPCIGLNQYGGGKLWGVCPHCGAGPRNYQYRGRYKSCSGCGLQQAMERVFTAVRFDLRNQRSVEPAMVTKALGYGVRVYGDPDE